MGTNFRTKDFSKKKFSEFPNQKPSFFPTMTGQEETILDLRRPGSMVDMKHLTLDTAETFVEKRTRSQTCPEKRFPRAQTLPASYSPHSPRPGHYDPRHPRPAPGHYDPRIPRTMGSMTFNKNGKPVISHAQLVREAFICKTAQEMMKEFTSTVLDVKLMRGERVMWTSVPEDLKYIFNVTDIKTVDSWKQTMHGDVQLDISMFNRGDKVKMAVQSVGVSNKHLHQPLIRGVPDHSMHPDTLAPSTGTTPRVPRSITSTPYPRSPLATREHSTRKKPVSPAQRSRAATAATTLTLGSSGTLSLSPEDEILDEKHRRFSVKKPIAPPRFARSGSLGSTLSEVTRSAFTTHSMLPRSRTLTSMLSESEISTRSVSTRAKTSEAKAKEAELQG